MKLLPTKRFISKYFYEIPEEYHNSFYHVNASLFQVVNYFTHKAYHVIFPELVETIKRSKSFKTDVEAAKFVEDHIKQLEYCDQFLDIRFPIKRNNGKFDILRGMRAYHGTGMNNNTCLGGLRIYENLTRHTVQGFAILSTYKNACFGLDISGSYGGIKICGSVYEGEDMKAAVQLYLKKLLPNNCITDVIEPDFNCGAKEMELMHEVCPKDSNISIVGKSVDLSGLKNYYKTGPAAVLLFYKKFLDDKYVAETLGLDSDLKKKTFIIYGLGKNGAEIAKSLERQGAICVGVREFNCTIYEPSGIPIQVLLKHYKKFGTILNFCGKAKETEGDQIFTEKCDILILAAVEKSILCHIADRMQAKVIIEACNGPITPTADKILSGKQKLIIPSILNCGAYSLQSYLEYLKNNSAVESLHEIYKDEKKLDQIFKSKLEEVADDVIKIEKDLNLNFDFRTACYVKAIRKIFDKIVVSDMITQKIQIN